MNKHHVSSCGCVCEELSCGTYRSLSKCNKHLSKQQKIEDLSQRYYESLGVLKDGEFQPTNHVKELEENLGKIVPASRLPSTSGLEIGGGASPYVKDVFLNRGYTYTGLEPSRWAGEFLREKYPSTHMVSDTLEQFKTDKKFSLILSAHSLEHMVDALYALKKMSNLLETGGLLYLVIPDNSDLVNPDHYWFFTPESIVYHIRQSGMEVIRQSVSQYVPKEKFIYTLARKVG